MGARRGQVALGLMLFLGGAIGMMALMVLFKLTYGA